MSTEQYNGNLGIGENTYLQTIIDNIDAVIALCDADKTVVMINKAGRSLLWEDAKMQPEELLGHAMDVVLEPLIYDGTSIVGLVAKKKMPMQRNIHYKLGNKTILYTAIPIIENDELRCIVVTGRDMTKLIKLEEQLATAEKLNLYYSGMVQKLAEFEKSEMIRDASAEQSLAMQEIGKSVESTNSLVQENTENAESLNRNYERMKNIAAELKKIMDEKSENLETT